MRELLSSTRSDPLS